MAPSAAVAAGPTRWTMVIPLNRWDTTIVRGPCAAGKRSRRYPQRPLHLHDDAAIP
jgi:hypothetical protein